MMTRRQAIKATALVTAVAATMPSAVPQVYSVNGAVVLQPLPYAFDALEPHIDAQTMQIHHDKHHGAYVENLNKALALPDSRKSVRPVEDLLKDLDSVSENIRTAVRNNGGGHYNHSLFWQMMKKGGSSDPTSELDHAMNSDFGSLGAFKQQFTEAAMKVFGSGWTWLVLDGKQLKIETTANQDTPLSAGKTPLLGLDVWEHAYYLKYQNKRADYIVAWWNVVNWPFVAERFEKFKP